MSDTPKATMSEACRCGSEFLQPEPINSRCGAEDCAERAYTRANERAEGLAKELVALRAELAEVRGLRSKCKCSPAPEVPHRVFKCRPCGALHPECDTHYCLAADATARVAELEKQLADKEEERLDAVAASILEETRATAAEAELARLRALPTVFCDAVGWILPHAEDRERWLEEQIGNKNLTDAARTQAAMDWAKAFGAVAAAREVLKTAAPLPSAHPQEDLTRAINIFTGPRCKCRRFVMPDGNQERFVFIDSAGIEQIHTKENCP